MNVSGSFHTMFSTDGLKGIVEFILSNQNDFVVKFKMHDDHFAKVDEQMIELMKLPAQFTALKRYKKEMLEMLRGKAMDHEKRVTELEASHAELRANNDRDHQKMTINIHNNKV